MTDDAMVVEQETGVKVRLAQGSYQEYKDHNARGSESSTGFFSGELKKI